MSDDVTTPRYRFCINFGPDRTWNGLVYAEPRPAGGYNVQMGDEVVARNSLAADCALSIRGNIDSVIGRRGLTRDAGCIIINATHIGVPAVDILLRPALAELGCPVIAATIMDGDRLEGGLRSTKEIRVGRSYLVSALQAWRDAHQLFIGSLFGPMEEGYRARGAVFAALDAYDLQAPEPTSKEYLAYRNTLLAIGLATLHEPAD